MFFSYILTVLKKLKRKQSAMKSMTDRILTNEQQILFLTRQNQQLAQQLRKNFDEVAELQKLMS